MSGSGRERDLGYFPMLTKVGAVEVANFSWLQIVF